MRRLPAIARLRIASTGSAAETAPGDPSGRARLAGAGASPTRRPARGGRASSADLDGFAESHCVAELEYLEPPTRGLARTVSRLVARGAGAGFAVAARATPPGDGPAVELEVTAPDAISAAAALVGALCAGMLERGVPAGLSNLREALSPTLALAALEKRGARIRIGA